MKKNIAVIFGGVSTEHDISILTALQVLSALDQQKYHIIPIYITSQGEWLSGHCLQDLKFFSHFDKKKLKCVAILPCSQYIFQKSLGHFSKKQKIDCAVICCHGKNGEDGTIQGLLELAKIPYTSSGVLASSVGLDKVAMKQIFSFNKIPICPFWSLSNVEYCKNGTKKKKNAKFPLIVKPNNLGSSIGISVCKNQTELQNALKLAFQFDDVALVEKYIEDLKEVNISVLGDSHIAICSVTEEPKNNGGILTFAKKYMSGAKNAKMHSSKTTGTKNGMQNEQRNIPANITQRQERQIKTLAKKIFACLGAKGVARIDFMIDNNTQKVYANEINTIPGSFAFYLWEKVGIPFSKLLDKLIEIALVHSKNQNKLTTTFASSVLNQNSKMSK